MDGQGTGYPRQVGIDAYGKGGFRFDGVSHRGSLLCLPSGMHAWAVNGASEVNRESLRLVLEEADNIDVLLLGMGPDLAPISTELRALFREHRIIVEAISTGSAVRTYNVLLAEQRSVAAALVAVEKVR